MEIIYSPKAVEDIAFWKKSGQKLLQKKIQHLIEDIQEHPHSGIGKPEQLKHSLTGCWSRHINDEHRIIYEVVQNSIHIHSLKDHYLKK